MDWLLGRKPSSQNPSPAPVQPPQLHHQQQEIFEAPDIDSLLKPHDPAALHPLANLDKQTLDYIILEDEQIKSAGALPSRGWTDDLCYGTGTTYLTGIHPFVSFPTFSPHFYPLSMVVDCANFSFGSRRHVGSH